MTVFNRLGYNFQSERFGDASLLSDGAKNTLGLIANNTPEFADWQKTDFAAGSIARATYF